MSRPLEGGAYRKVRAPSPGRSAPMVATSDFSGFESSDCALARAAASAAIDSLDRCMVPLRLEEIEAHGSRSRPARANPVPERLTGVFGQQRLELSPDPFVLKVCAAGPA